MTERTIPVGRMPVDALPPPTSVSFVDQSVRLVADASAGGVLLHHRPDSQVRPDRFDLAWVGVPSAVANAIWAHYRDHGRGTWTWRHPRTGELVVVFHATPPSINWHHRISRADVRATLERATARN